MLQWLCVFKKYDVLPHQRFFQRFFRRLDGELHDDFLHLAVFLRGDFYDSSNLAVNDSLFVEFWQSQRLLFETVFRQHIVDGCASNVEFRTPFP